MAQTERCMLKTVSTNNDRRMVPWVPPSLFSPVPPNLCSRGRARAQLLPARVLALKVPCDGVGDGGEAERKLEAEVWRVQGTRSADVPWDNRV